MWHDAARESAGMPRLVVFLVALAATAVTVLLVAPADVPMRDVLTLMLGALCLLWLLLLLTVAYPARLG